MIDRRRLLALSASAGVADALANSAAAVGMFIADRKIPAILVNQIGYLPECRKFAVLQKLEPEHAIRVVDVGTRAVVASLKVLPSNAGFAGDDDLQTVEFSSLRRPGRYQLISGETKSVPFSIGSGIYNSLLRQLLRSYYLQRCGVTLSDRETGLGHAACHIQDGVLARADSMCPQGTVVPNVGGWHDAGDFGKYVSTAAVTVGEILSLYEQYPQLFSDGQLSIPESGNGQPDILDEMSVGLSWMLAMQRSDGAVYRKASGAEWPKPVSPDSDHQRRFVYGISTPETAKFSAAMAIAARVYKNFDETRAVTYLQAALAAWDFIDHHPEFIFDCDPLDNSGSGSYMSNATDREQTLLGDADDRAWAGAELFLTTKEEKFLDPVFKFANLGDYGLFEWKNPAPLGFQNLLNSGKAPAVLESLLLKLLSERAMRLEADARSSPWGLSNRRIIWGSNKIAAANGSCLLTAARHCDSQTFLTSAIRQLDYLLGVNPVGKCFVTAAGSQPVEHVAHLFARAVQKDIPGLLVGGPNNDAQDKIAPGGLGLLSYLDDSRSYSTNEYAIDYNAALIGLIGGVLGQRPHVHKKSVRLK
jgi:endoglucanase